MFARLSTFISASVVFQYDFVHELNWDNIMKSTALTKYAKPNVSTVSTIVLKDKDINNHQIFDIFL